MTDIRVEYERLLIKTIDRIVERAICIRAASTLWPKKIEMMHMLNKEIKSFWVSKLDENLFDIFNLRSVSWDLLQSDYTFDRPHIDQIASQGLLHINESINKSFIPELIIKFEHNYEIIHSAFPLLERIRAIDVVNEICFEKLVNDINVIRRNISLIKNNSEVDEELYSTLITPFFYYPEFLYPGITFRNYPRDKNTVYDFCLCIASKAKNDDILLATEDFKFQVVRYRDFISCNQSYHEIFESCISNVLRPSSRVNDHVLQFNSITNTLCAILVWDKIHGEKMKQQDAIRAVSSLISVNIKKENGDGTSEKKQIRDRLKYIESAISDKAKNYKEENIILDIFGMME